MLLTAYFKGIPDEVASGRPRRLRFMGIVRNVIYPMGKPAIAVNATSFPPPWTTSSRPRPPLQEGVADGLRGAERLREQVPERPHYRWRADHRHRPASVMYLFFPEVYGRGRQRRIDQDPASGRGCGAGAGIGALRQSAREILYSPRHRRACHGRIGNAPTGEILGKVASRKRIILES